MSNEFSSVISTVAALLNREHTIIHVLVDRNCTVQPCNFLVEFAWTPLLSLSFTVAFSIVISLPYSSVQKWIHSFVKAVTNRNISCLLICILLLLLLLLLLQ